MLILAFESSAKAASVALVRDGELVAQSFQCTGLTHSRTLLPMAESLLKNCEISLKDVDAFAVAYGPGSFTGIRIGVSTVKGLSWASGKPCAGVSTLEAMACHGKGFEGIICPLMDARRNQVYNALFRYDSEGRLLRLCKDRAIALSELAEELEKVGEKILLLGDGAELAAGFFGQSDIDFRLAPPNLILQDAYGVAVAARGAEFADSAALLPVYLRLSQAERERQARMDRKIEN